jgi:hypothetical protein
MKAIYTRARTGGAEDVACTTHDFWFEGHDATDAECDTLAATFVTWWDAIRVGVNRIIALNTGLTELRFYKGYDGDGTPGAVDYIKTYSAKVGGCSLMCPPQVACSITEMTDVRKHWGRFYIPSIGTDVLTADGTMTTSYKTALADATEAMYESWGALADCTPIVWGRRTASLSYNAIATPRWRPTWFGAPSTAAVGDAVAMAVQSIRVDEILDIQRRRRWESSLGKVTRQLA